VPRRPPLRDNKEGGRGGPSNSLGKHKRGKLTEVGTRGDGEEVGHLGVRPGIKRHPQKGTRPRAAKERKTRICTAL